MDFKTINSDVKLIEQSIKLIEKTQNHLHFPKGNLIKELNLGRLILINKRERQLQAINELDEKTTTYFKK